MVRQVSYTQNHRNRLTELAERDSNGVIVRSVVYVYDIFDRRIAKIIDPDGSGPEEPREQRFVYDGDHILLEFEGDQPETLTHRYLHGAVVDQIFAREDVESLWQPGEVLWALTDHLGTVRDVIDSMATVVNHIRYDSFGKITLETNAAVDFLFAYTGRERDEETGLYYYRARYYDPAVGRFVSEDPLGFAAGDTNLVRYVNNLATVSTDPTGRQQNDTPGRRPIGVGFERRQIQLPNQQGQNRLPVVWQIRTDRPPQFPVVIIQLIEFEYDLTLPGQREQGEQDYFELIGVIPPGSTMPTQYGHIEVAKKWFRFFHDNQLGMDAATWDQKRPPIPPNYTFQKALNLPANLVYHDIYRYEVPPGTTGRVKWTGDLRLYELTKEIADAIAQWNTTSPPPGPKLSTVFFAHAPAKSDMYDVNKFRKAVWDNSEVPYIGNVVTVEATFPNGQVTVGTKSRKHRNT
jgi:RHS repeat-associated protein